MVDVAARQQALEALVMRIGQIAPSQWEQIYLAFETHPDGAEPTWVMIGAIHADDRWAFGQFDPDAQVYDLTTAFREASEPRWSALELKVDRTGRFATELSYDGAAPAGKFSAGLLERLQGYPAAFHAQYGQPPHAG